MKALASGGERMKGNHKGVRAMVGVLGAVAIVLLFATGLALAGSFTEVWVNHVKISDNSPCRLYNGVYVNGVYTPDNAYDAVIRWKLDSGSWHITSMWQGGNGAIAFDFTMNETPTGSSTLYLWGDETYGSDGYWSCYQV